MTLTRPIFASAIKAPARSSGSRDDMPEHTGWIDDVENYDTPGLHLRWRGSDHTKDFWQPRRLNVTPQLIDVFNYELHHVIFRMLFYKEGLQNEGTRAERQNPSGAVRKYSVNRKSDVLIKSLADCKILRRYEGTNSLNGRSYCGIHFECFS